MPAAQEQINISFKMQTKENSQKMLNDDAQP